MHMNLLKDAKIVRVMNAAAAAKSALTSAVVDMQGYDSVCFIAELGDVTNTSVLTLTGKTNTANSTSSPTPTALADPAMFTAAASDADDKMLVLDMHKPRERFVFAELTRTTANAVVEGMTAILYNAHEKPVTQDTGVIASSFVNDPAAA